jgi:kynurenine formamidase
LGVKTLGFDYLSVKKFGSDYDVHKVLIDNLTLFEGLNLSQVRARAKAKMVKDTVYIIYE